MHQRFGLFSSPSIRFQRIVQAGDLLISMSVHRTADNVRDFTETKAVVEERLDGNFVCRIHRRRHGAADSERLVPEIEARKAIMVGLAEGQLSDLRQIQ